MFAGHLIIRSLFLLASHVVNEACWEPYTSHTFCAQDSLTKTSYIIYIYKSTESIYTHMCTHTCVYTLICICISIIQMYIYIYIYRLNYQRIYTVRSSSSTDRVHARRTPRMCKKLCSDWKLWSKPWRCGCTMVHGAWS